MPILVIWFLPSNLGFNVILSLWNRSAENCKAQECTEKGNHKNEITVLTVGMHCAGYIRKNALVAHHKQRQSFTDRRKGK